MEKKLKKVQRGAGFGFVLLKILRILLIIVAVVLIVSLVVLAVVNENDLPLDAVKDGKLVLALNDLNLNQLGLDAVPDVGALVKDGVLTLDLKDAKLVVMLLVGAGILALAATYVLMLIAGNLFKHMKKEDTPFTAGNVRRLRLLGIFHIVDHIRAGRLVPVLDDFNSGELETISAVYVGHAGPLPARVRAFIDFLAAEVDVDWPMARAVA